MPTNRTATRLPWLCAAVLPPMLSNLFTASDPAVKRMIRQVIAVAHRTNTKIGLCGQAPSDDPTFAQFLVEAGIDSISFNPDALVAGIKNIRQAEVEISTEAASL